MLDNIVSSLKKTIVQYFGIGLDTEGIYRVSGVKSKVDHLKGLYNEGKNIMFLY